MAEDRISLLYSLFANLLEYPTPALAQQAKTCYEALMADQPQAAKKMEGIPGLR